ncbi:BQ5605_C004g02709 [Microbotryum silenes-dioicae]|uniref:BQ5605_C004g02709 protein n=1 Tax=Microbotryum silenes-dioicae TaxID=796604 RepID=A0A2X0MBV0_9BASI|nr:BQ5605_C004g02709 [Microbotryum silenes-dioicae]
MFARIASRSSRVLVPTSNPALASTSTSTSHSHPFSSTSHASESKRLRKARLVRKAHIEKKALLVQSHLQNQPDPVLGYNKKIGGDLWERCLLKRTLLDREVLWEGVKRGSIEQEEQEGKERKLQKTTVERHYNFGLNERDVKLLGQSLPNVSMMRDVVTASGRLASQELNENRLAKAEQREMDKKDKLMRILDLGNAGSKAIQVENVRRIVKAFGKDENDTGSPEVVAAILTARIHSLLTHLISQPRDIHNRRSLRAMIQDRAKALKYLKVTDVRRYEDCLLNIGVEPRAVEGEVVVTKKALRELIRGE